MKATKGEGLTRLVETALEKAAYWGAVRTFMNTVQWGDPMTGEPEHVREAHDVLGMVIWHHECDAWKDAFMFALTDSSEIKERVKHLAYDRFLRKGLDISHLMHTETGPVKVSEEDALREIMKRAFGVEKSGEGAKP